MSERSTALLAWAESELQESDLQLSVASSDASFRHYYRLSNGEQSWIGMDAPPQHEDCRPFIDVAERLSAASVHAPAIHAFNEAQGFMLLEDLGNTTFLSVLNEECAEALYGDAMTALLDMQTQADASGLSAFDDELYDNEFALFTDWLLTQYLGMTLDSQTRSELEAVKCRLVESAKAQPQVFVHRDYHSRNLMLCESKNPGVIDFQDAVIGPATYDLVSLLRDCYIVWPDALVNKLRQQYWAMATERGLSLAASESDFNQAFDLMGLQRHIKAIGIFARLYLRDGKDGYLADMPTVLEYIIRVADQHPDFAWLAKFCQEEVKPRLLSCAQ